MQIAFITSLLRTMKIGIFIITVCLSLHIIAADNNEAMTSPDDVLPVEPRLQGYPISDDESEEQEETIEEITVIGQQQIFTLQQQIIQAEDRAFDIFNELNDDDMYDIHCRMEARTGTLLKKRMCRPNFYHRATADNASEYLALIGEYSNYGGPSPSTRNVFTYRFPIFKDKVKELAKENPELLDAMQEIFALTEELQNSRDTYHGMDDK